MTMFGIPASEPKKVRTKWQELEAMTKDADTHGGLIPQAVAAILLDVSRQRINELIRLGTFRSFEYFGKPFVCVNDVVAFVNSERKGGRPIKEAGIVETFRRTKKVMAEK